MTISDDMTLSEALALHGIELKPGSTRCKRKMFRDGVFAGSVTAAQGWALVAALNARSSDADLTIEEHAAKFVGLPRAA